MNLAEYIDGQRDQHLAELCDFLRIPSVSAKSEHKPDIERGARWVAGNLRAAGFKNVEIIPTSLHPLVYAESLEAPGKPTILFYGHYDVQPAEPLNLWTSPAFEPTVRSGNLFGRGTADDKGQVHIHLKAFESLQKIDGKLPINVKVLIEGEEEVGSVSLWDYVQKNKEKLKADALVVSDTSMLGKGVPSITYGLRGLNYYQIELTGPERDLHSGVYGGAVPNPLTILTELFVAAGGLNSTGIYGAFIAARRPALRDRMIADSLLEENRVVRTLVHHVGADCFERPRLVQIDDAFGPRLAAHAAQGGPARTRKCARMKLSPPAEGIGNREHDELGDRDALH